MVGHSPSRLKPRIDDIGKVGPERVRNRNRGREGVVGGQLSLLKQNVFQGCLTGRQRELVIDHLKIGIQPQ